MKNFITLAISLACLLLIQVVHAQSQIEGVWQAEETIWEGGSDSLPYWAEPGTNTNPEPSLYIFTKQHYSILSVRAPRTISPEGISRDELSYDQQMSEYLLFTANAGTYEINGSTLTTRPSVALGTRFMSGGEANAEFRIDGDKLILTSEDGVSTRILRRLE
jgi:hypothetical protein